MIRESKKKSMTERLMNPQEVQHVLNEQASKLRSKWRKVVTGDEKKRIRDRLKETQEEPKYVKFFDKVAFTIGVLNMGVCQYFLLNRPDLFPTWYAIIIPVILGSRYFYFRGGGMQYFMIDFCYFTIFCSMMNLLFIKNSPLFFKVCFICCTGPLTLAIPAWRNSFVFHDYDKIVSVYIHILPSMVYYTLRHNNSSIIGMNNGNNLCHMDNCDDLHIADYLVTLGLYMFWQISYLIKTEFWDKKKLDNNPELLTSLRWLAKDTKNAAAKLFLKIYRLIGIFGKDEEFDSKTLKTKAVFVIAQLLFTMVSFILTPLMYYSATFHLTYILAIITNSVFNGASFYIEVFSKRYNTHIGKIEEMHAIAKAAKVAMSELKESASAKGSSQALTSIPGCVSPGRKSRVNSTVPVLPPLTPTRASSGSVLGISLPEETYTGNNGGCEVTGTEVEQGSGSDDGLTPRDRSAEQLSRLTALLQHTSDSAWQEMKAMYDQDEELRKGGMYVPDLSDDEEEYAELSPDSEDYVVYTAHKNRSTSPVHVTGSKDGTDQQGIQGEGKDQEKDENSGSLSDEDGDVPFFTDGRFRNDSVMSIDR